MPLDVVAAVLIALAVYVLESVFASGIVLVIALAVTALVCALLGLLIARNVRRSAS